ncbi:MAG: RsmB/NOP family class I SAM-dependent RNA methyltransferase [Lachnospiraceae bacterium]|nr:RsmB/NOP family class I SAM-dependent RNA methyltransferase [Lachnospiraceae bacterium]
MELPQEFLERMERMLGEEYEEFLRTYEEPRKFGLRVNTLKISVDEFVKLAPFHLTPIPWIDNGFYYEREDDPARHPFYYAGLYYLQEPSAMTPANILPVTPGEYVLDLCAAPGGKATALAAKLQGQGLLVANDISASRAKALLKNLEVFGVKNSFVTNAVPIRLAEQFEETFDKILVDAPCSGEGMFRKDVANAKAWSLEKVDTCARTQRDITLQAVKMLRPGGMMLYSTCTFAEEENEGTIAYLLENCPEMELTEIPWQEGYTHGRTGKNPELSKCVRIFPHKMEGEGHFLALLKKKGAHCSLHQKTARTSGKPSKEEEKILMEFLKDVSMDWSMEQIEVRAGQVYFVPEMLHLKGRIPFLRNGLYLGEIKKNRFEPSQSFAMALKGPAMTSGSREKSLGEYASCVNFDYSDERVRRYLCGETVEVDDLSPTRPKGWQLVCVNGYPLGWGKLVNGTLKNKYHPGWRMQV